ncbi:MAG TPA: deaminase domain-containing protein [Ktedonobacterales bacterium]|nr:deaminase domain-containing protein [Ktedonobacterales bacterium]
MFFDDVLQTSPDAIRPVAQMYFDRADAHDTQLRSQQTGAATLQTVWTGDASTTYQTTHAAVTQKGQADVSAMRSTAHTLMIIMNLINIILTAITIFKILQAAVILLAAAGFFTFGATDAAAAGAEEGAIAADATAQATSLSAKAILKAVFSALLGELKRRAIGTAIGATAGLTIGVGTSIADHRPLGDAIWHTGLDTLAGAGGGFEMSGWTPWTSTGLAYGFTQAAVTDLANGNFDLEGNFDTVMGDTALFTAAKQAWDLPGQIQSQIDDLTAYTQQMANVRQALNAGKARTVAFGDYSIGGDQGTISAVSGQNTPGSLPNNPIFQVNSAGGFNRAFDSERIILENIAATYAGDPSVSGQITLVVDPPFQPRVVCASCQSVIAQFESMFPNITVNVVIVPR